MLPKIGNFSFLYKLMSLEVNQSCLDQVVRAGNKKSVYDKGRNIILKGKPLKLLLVT